MNLTETLQIASFGLATISSGLAILAFRRNKKIELQNQLYKIKLDAFANIVFEIDNFFTVISKNLNDILKIAKAGDINSAIERFLLIADEVDTQLYTCNSLIIKNSVYFSVESTELLEQFSRNVFSDKKEFNIAETKVFLAKFEEYHDIQLKLSNKAVEKIREELGLEKLNTALYKRMK